MKRERMALQTICNQNMRDLSIYVDTHTPTHKEIMKQAGRPRNFTCSCTKNNTFTFVKTQRQLGKQSMSTRVKVTQLYDL